MATYGFGQGGDDLPILGGSVSSQKGPLLRRGLCSFDSTNRIDSENATHPCLVTLIADRTVPISADIYRAAPS